MSTLIFFLSSLFHAFHGILSQSKKKSCNVKAGGGGGAIFPLISFRFGNSYSVFTNGIERMIIWDFLDFSICRIKNNSCQVNWSLRSSVSIILYAITLKIEMITPLLQKNSLILNKNITVKCNFLLKLEKNLLQI